MDTQGKKEKEISVSKSEAMSENDTSHVDDQFSKMEPESDVDDQESEIESESGFESDWYPFADSSPPSSPASSPPSHSRIYNSLQNSNSVQEMQSFNVWEHSINESHLSMLYRPPYEILHEGDFYQSLIDASIENKWLIVNIQSKSEFNSHVLNRDIWSNETVFYTIRENFIFWQVYNDTTDGEKVKAFYHLDSIPAVLLLDPITGQKMRFWCGAIKTESFLEDLIQFMDERPKEALISNKRNKLSEAEVSKNEEETVLNKNDTEFNNEEETGLNKKEDNNEEETLLNKKEDRVYPHLAEEPKTSEGNVCRIALRFPDGRRLKRNFLLTDSIKLLWSFCNSQLKESEPQQTFKLMVAIPGESRILDYDREQNFRESGISNSIISVFWE
ncbi:plant UBX domain-containing protein 7-like [Magnolia sinica]|uniref:plant UBX domain-containing protein 7-like n=1 Tax=Magnolia sinica TaxID=86752 RepID=UPI00265ADA70|nr:plant UBX domain-containing protein 7-like [Magnolia sinica]